jgi:DNA-binding CsgD family transcriptional regulator
MMEGDVAGTMKLVDQVLEVGGPDLDERYVIRSLNHRGVVTDIAEYPAGRPFLDQARDRAEAAGLWYEESRALFNHASAALEFRDLAVASDYAQRAIASAVRHELLFSEHYASAIHALVLELEGKWDEAEDIARELLDRNAITQMVVLTLIATLDARKGRATAPATLTQAWEICIEANEYQRLGPIAIAAAEIAWISGSSDIPLADVKEVMERGINLGFEYSPGSIAFWLWKLGELSAIPEGIAEPYRLVMEGKPTEAEAIWEAKGIPYERGLALMHGDEKDRLDALEVFETLGATAVAAKLRKTLRDEGVAVPRGKSRDTRRHAAGLTARQAEVLQLLDQGLTNIEIADRLFVSPRTVEHHVAAVMSKLNATTRDQAVASAAEQGLLTIGQQLPTH